MTERSAQSPSLAKIFFMENGQKLTNLFQKNVPPPKNQDLFFGGGGSGDRWSLRTMCLGLCWSRSEKGLAHFTTKQRFCFDVSFYFFSTVKLSKKIHGHKMFFQNKEKKLEAGFKAFSDEEKEKNNFLSKLFRIIQSVIF
jgi:hypothetical protein